MRILFVHPATDMSIGDVARGYRAALERQGHLIKDYMLGQRMMYHRKAIPAESKDPRLLAFQASETILNEAIYHQADLVLIVSGLNVHPIALHLLGQVGFKVATVFTESPYDDPAQYEWTDIKSKTGGEVDLTVFTNDRYSAKEYDGWVFLPPSYDPAIHHPVDPDPEFECDALMVGTGWPERQVMLESIDWTGINLRLYGIWPNIKPESPLHDYYYPSVISNHRVPSMYCSAKVNINIHRSSDVALTPGPRVYELAACGAFQISDSREDLVNLFGGAIPTFRDGKELGDQIRYYLERPDERRLMAAQALDAVCDEDFDKRASTLIAAITTTRTDRMELVGAAAGKGEK